MKQSYSVLKMSKRHPTDRTSHTYEHSIIIGNFSGHSYEDIFHKIAKTLREEAYFNQFGEKVQWKIVALLDIFEGFDLQETPLYTEVYSRYFPFKEAVSIDTVCQLYFSDLVLYQQKR